MEDESVTLSATTTSDTEDNTDKGAGLLKSNLFGNILQKIGLGRELL